MKKIIISLVAFASISAMAAPAVSEFERGFKEGKNTCTSEYWSCSATCTFTGFEYVNGKLVDRDLSMSGEGFSRGQALDNLAKRSDFGPGTNNCRTLVIDGQAVCKKL